MQDQIEKVWLGMTSAEILYIIFYIVNELLRAVFYHYKDKKNNQHSTLRISSNHIDRTLYLVVGTIRMFHPLKTSSKIFVFQAVINYIVILIY